MKLSIIALIALLFMVSSAMPNLSKCIGQCREHVEACRNDQMVCFQAFMQCTSSKDPLNCLARSNDYRINNIVQCLQACESE